jgi:hypothetical protein
MKAMVTLTSTESKRLIAKAVAAHPDVKRAYEKGRIIVGGGTTNGYVVEELTHKIIDKANYTFGIVNQGLHCSTAPENRKEKIPLCLVDGEISDQAPTEILKDFTNHDVFIKGANAVDPEGNVGVLVASPVGGTIGGAYPTLVSRKSKLIVPVGLEKLIPSVLAAADTAGMYDWDFSLGMRCSLWPITDAYVVTELEAFDILCDVEAVHFSSGGTGGSAGAVTIALLGDDQNIRDAVSLVKSIKGEPPLPDSKRACADCDNPCDFVR